ncbi:MAG: metallophosphoesterase [Nitrospira bacterium SM23_35]|nr:MAG: metallophosphoesterase [Nitrospira bacterium SM23_35]
MTLFLLTFFLLYGSLHLYAFLRARAAFAFSTTTGIFIAGLMLVMTISPIIIRFSEKAGSELFARLMSYVGYTWMGIIFLFVSFSILIDVYRLCVAAGGSVLGKDLTYLSFTGRYAVLLPLVISIMIALYGFFEAVNIRTEKLTIWSHKIPPDVNRVRIAQISDVHLGLIVRESRLERILSEIERAEPDILVSTGDLVDGQIDNLSGLAAMFREINPRFGKYAITGNHEFYAGLEQSMWFTEQAGFTMLRGERVDIQNILTIAGVDDPQANSFGLYRGGTEKEVLADLPDNRFVLLLKHRPLIDESSRGLFDLQLSGHVHRGQIFPFSIITGLYYETQSGLAQLSDGSSLYVSRGSGTWGPPIRFLSPPEVTVIDLVRADE